MKIAVLGYSGAGKSTLARMLAATHGTAVFHFDAVQFLPGWEIRNTEEKRRITEAFLDSHDAWVMDGNYTRFSFERRMEEADTIILLLFNRFSCLARAYRRYRRYKHTTRPDMAEGCNEKFDAEFAKWILYKGRTKAVRGRFKQVIAQYGDKVIVLKNQRDLDRYIRTLAKP